MLERVCFVAPDGTDSKNFFSLNVESSGSSEAGEIEKRETGSARGTPGREKRREGGSIPFLFPIVPRAPSHSLSPSQYFPRPPFFPLRSLRNTNLLSSNLRSKLQHGRAEAVAEYPDISPDVL